MGLRERAEEGRRALVQVDGHLRRRMTEHYDNPMTGPTMSDPSVLDLLPRDWPVHPSTRDPTADTMREIFFSDRFFDTAELYA